MYYFFKLNPFKYFFYCLIIMARRSILEVTKEILKFLEENGEASLNKISVKTRTNRQVVERALKFLIETGRVQEIRVKFKTIYVRQFSLK